MQSVRREVANGGEPLGRGEWETPLASPLPDLASLMPLLPEKTRADLQRDALQPIFSAEIHRQQHTIALPSGTVEVAIDRGHVEAGGRTMPISEIGLELREGSALALYDLATQINDGGAFKPTVRSLATRGFDLARDVPPSVCKPPRPRLDADVSVDEAFASILRASLRHILDSQPAAEDGRDPEGVHQLRVGLRRLRSALSLLRLFAGSPRLEAFRADAKWLATSLGEARGWDIFVGQTLPEVAKSCSSIGGFDLLQPAAEACRAAAYREARAAMTDPRCSRFQLALGAWIEQRGWRADVTPEGLSILAGRASVFAGRVLAGQHRKLLKHGRHFDRLSPEELHELRLAAKKLRYMADFFLQLLRGDKSAKRYARSLAELQEALGNYNDMTMTGHLKRAFESAALPAASSQAFGAVLGWQARGLTASEAGLRAAWRSVAEISPSWLKLSDRGEA